MEVTNQRRILMLLASIAVQMILGGVYAWSSFTPSLTAHGISLSQSGFIFGTMIATFTLSAIPGSFVLRHRGARTTIAISALLYFLGNMVASSFSGSFFLLLFGMGILVGCSIGFGYVSVLGLAMHLFPHKRGTVAGLLMAAFGGGSILLSNLARHLMENQNLNVLQIFRFLGITYGIILFICSLPMERNNHRVGEKQQVGHQLASKEFISLVLGLFAGTFAGLLIIGNLYPIATEMEGNLINPAIHISLFSIGNVLGRLVWGIFQDKYGSRNSILASLLFLALAITPLVFSTHPFVVLVVALLSGLGFGACFVVYASATLQYFGIESFSRLYPLCFLAYGLSGLIGPGTGSMLATLAGSYSYAILLSLGILFLSIITIWKQLPRQ
ncbi:MFS transporter [Sphaerochaeta pleomorpha]|nr:MFS transporter [Sphaerochaeta pleomorpha]